MIVVADVVMVVTLRIRLRMILLRGMTVPVRMHFTVVRVRVGVAQVSRRGMGAHANRRSGRNVRQDEACHCAQDYPTPLHPNQYIDLGGRDNVL